MARSSVFNAISTIKRHEKWKNDNAHWTFHQTTHRVLIQRQSRPCSEANKRANDTEWTTTKTTQVHWRSMPKKLD